MKRTLSGNSVAKTKTNKRVVNEEIEDTPLTIFNLPNDCWSVILQKVVIDEELNAVSKTSKEQGLELDTNLVDAIKTVIEINHLFLQ